MTESKVCIIYTKSNGLHHHPTEHLTKKKLYSFARLVQLDYEIGIFKYSPEITKNNKFKLLVKKSFIIKPRCLNIPNESVEKHGITNEIAKEKGVEIETVLNNFVSDMFDVKVVITHDINFHLKTIMAEYLRYNISFSFVPFVIVDTKTFYHSLENPKLKELYNHLYKKEYKNDDKLELIKLCFIKLYEQYLMI